jgi:hypothetical protein
MVRWQLALIDMPASGQDYVPGSRQPWAFTALSADFIPNALKDTYDYSMLFSSALR